MTLILSPKQQELLQKIAENEGIKNYQLEISSGKQKGDGYLSNIVLVSINSPEKTLKIVLKVASNSVKFRDQIPVRGAFQREYFIYEEVFEHYKQLQKNTSTLFTSTKYYGGTLEDAEECLALENLKELTFQLWNRKLPMNDHHVVLTFKTYAKYHALSFVTKYQYPDKYKKWVENTDNIRQYFFKEHFDQQLKKFIDDLMHLFEEENIKLKLQEHYFNWREVNFPKCDEKYIVLSHGDSWCNNFLYKYEDSKDTTKPIDIRMLDFQLAIFTTPVHDLSYFLFSDTDKQCYSKYRDYLAIYHNTMADVLRDHNLDINIVYPFEILENDWQKYSRYGLYCSMFVLKAALVSNDDVLDVDAIAENDCDVFESFMESLPGNEEYNRRVAELVRFAIDKKFI